MLNFLKIRASIGQNGNSVYNYGGQNQYLYLTTWTTNATEDQIGNENISWEVCTKSNIGIEAEFCNSVSIGLDLFYNKNKNLIVTDIATIPNGFMGISDAVLPPANLGTSNNKGFELTMHYCEQFKSGLELMLNAHVSRAKNQIDYLAEMPYNTRGDERFAYAYRKQGYALGQTWGYQSDGLFNDQSDIDKWSDQTALGDQACPGDIRYKDLTGDKLVDEKDKAPLGPLNRPTYFYGFNAQINYKNFDFTVQLNGMADRHVRLHGIGRHSNNDNFTEYMKNAWSADNPNSNLYPRLDNRNNSPNYTHSDFWIENGSFIRLRNVELGYTLPKFTNRKQGNLRFYVNMLNPLVWHHLPTDDFDPESSNSDNTNFPIMKAFNMGVNLKF